METTLKYPGNLNFGLSEQQMIFTHHTTDENTEGNTTYINLEPINNNPDAILFVTPNWNSTSRIYNDHPIGVCFNEKKGLWGIYNQDREVMPLGLKFNVFANVELSTDDAFDTIAGVDTIPFRI